VIARVDNNRYAFYRGKTWLGQPPVQVAVPVQTVAPQGEAKTKDGLEGQLLQNVYQNNSSIQSGQNQRFDQNFYQQNRKGVQAAEAAAE
jgi:hypothetical protein